MWALVDCNSFFCSVEKAFHPGLKDKPVVVLSSNDGIIVALTPEAKDLGLRRGDPLFRVRKTVEDNKVAVFSTNMQLYAAMSRRVTNILRQSVEHIENYSIDESFCNLRGYDTHYNLSEFMRSIAQKIRLWTDIPVSIGIAPSKTLAKVGSKFAKQYPGYKGVCLIDTEEKRRKALKLFPLDDVWGIGRKSLAKLKELGVRTPLEFADKSEAWARQHFPKPGVQTWMELNGQSCIDTAEVIRKQSICTSRSFGELVGDLDSLKASVTHFASSCANNLRAQESLCKAVSVFVSSNRFREDLQQYGNFATMPLPVPSSDTIEITQAAIKALESIYKPGIMYKKTGVILSGISDAESTSGMLFDPLANRPQREDLMRTIDSLNMRYGCKTVQLTSESGENQLWQSKSGHRSGNYLSDINEILTIG